MNKYSSEIDLMYDLFREKGYSRVNISGYDIVFKKGDGLNLVFFPDIAVRRSVLSISGSIGMAVTNQKINGGLDEISSMDPGNGVVFSVRLENFPEIILINKFNQDSREEDICKLSEFILDKINKFVPSKIDDVDVFSRDINWSEMISRSVVRKFS